jgi:dihydrolipoamide dehydrogenase
MPSEYDVVVIGAGPTGENVAARAVRGGMTAAIVEAELVGGECSYWACMPSKALLRSPQAIDEALALAGAREAVTRDLAALAVLRRRDDFTSHWKDDGQVQWLRDNRIDLVRGHGRLAGVRRVDVDGTVLTARHAVAICTGTRAAIPPIAGLAGAKPWTSREATSAQAAPRRLAMLGGGGVACEMAAAWRRLGTESVPVLQRGDRLLPGHEPFAGDAVRVAIERRGGRVVLGANTTRVERRADGRVALTLESGDVVEADQLLVAAGREPNTHDVGLASVGLEPGSWLDVDASMRVRAVQDGWLYAAGDVNHRALLTHIGKYQARVCGDVIAARAAGTLGDDVATWSPYAASSDETMVPQVVFTDPEIGAVGLTEAAARKRGLAVRVADYDIGRVAGASLFADGYQGKARAIVDERRGILVGMTLMGPAVGELIHSATVAIVGEVPLGRLWHAVPSYPTISEVWLRLLETLGM